MKGGGADGRTCDLVVDDRVAERRFRCDECISGYRPSIRVFLFEDLPNRYALRVRLTSRKSIIEI